MDRNDVANCGDVGLDVENTLHATITNNRVGACLNGGITTFYASRDVRIEDKDLRIDVFRSSGPGGQSVNTTDSAVRITHIPSGIVVSQQDQKSQLQNKAKGMEVLRARLLDLRLSEQEAERSRLRKSQVSTGDRSAKIRTYNFPQGRVTDHRVGVTLYDIDGVMNGEIGPFLDAIQLANAEESLAG
jgi:peptide chain release factor 1